MRPSDSDAPAPTRHRPRAAGSLVTTFAGNVGVLALNLATGVLSARLLEPDGRGTFAAVSVVVVMAAVLGQNGLPEAATYYVARDLERARSTASTCAVMLLPLSAVSTAVAFFVVPWVFAAQPQSTVELGRVAVLATGAIMAMQVGMGVVAGLQRFALLTVYRVCQPLLFLGGLLLLAVVDRVTAATTLAALLASYAVVAVAVLAPLVLGSGRRGPSRARAVELFSYGFRLQGQVVGSVGSTRLDLAVLPAVVAAAQIGLYSVAVSVASIVIALFWTLGNVVSPLASTGDRHVAMRLVERTTRVVLAAASLCAVSLAVLAPWLVSLVYGEAYAASVEPLRLLLPGCVLLGTSQLLAGGLRAIGRPGASSAANLAGLVVTIPGLVLALPRYGISGAAVTSSAAYATVFLTSLILLSRASPFRARAVLDVAALGGDVRWVLKQVRERLGQAGASRTTRSGASAGTRTAAQHGTLVDGGSLSAPPPGPHTGPPAPSAPELRSPHRRDVMPRSIGQRPTWYIGLLIALPALLGAAVSGLIAYDSVDVQHRANGVVQLSEIAGNANSGELNPYAADLQAALQSTPVREQVEQVLGPDVQSSGVEVQRLDDASRVSISLETSGAGRARAALLAAGRAGYAALVEQQAQLLQVRERAALSRLQALDAQVAQARAAEQAATPADAAAALSARQRAERLRSIAVEELSRVQGQTALVAELRSGSATTPAVVVTSVEPVSRLPQVLPVFAVGLVAGAIPGTALAVALRRRERSAALRQHDEATAVAREPRKVLSPTPANAQGHRAGQTGEPQRGTASEVPAR